MPPTRRDFIKTSTLLAAAALSASPAFATARRRATIKVGVIGCGGRGTGAAVNALSASPDTEIWALADVFPDRLAGSRNELANQGDLSSRAHVPDERCFTGFDAYQKLLASGVDVVILATPPHFRPIHLAAAVAAGKHVFMEKPVAVDPTGVRSVLASGEAAAAKKLSIVAGTQRRHEKCYLESMSRLKSGAIGRIVSAQCWWNQGSLWMHPRQPAWSDMEWQLRNWLYFTWLSGDHICEQHVHNLDVCNWAIGAHPTRCLGMGGRQVRTDPAYGQIFDHFAVEYEYPGGITMTSMCRQIDGCDSRVAEAIQGTDGTAWSTSGQAVIEGSKPWKFTGDEPDPYTQEHIDLYNAITTGQPINEAKNVAEATLTAIMGRMSAYTGKSITWDQALNSKLNLAPNTYAFGPLPVAEVAVPGKTPLV